MMSFRCKAYCAQAMHSNNHLILHLVGNVQNLQLCMKYSQRCRTPPSSGVYCCMQQRFAEGLAIHLTSGADLHSSAEFPLDDLLAGLPADPTMAGLLEPLVLPADAYQIPPGLQSMPGEPSHVWRIVLLSAAVPSPSGHCQRYC